MEYEQITTEEQGRGAEGYPLVPLLLLLLVLEGLMLFFLFLPQSEQGRFVAEKKLWQEMRRGDEEAVQRISDIKGALIDSGAVMTVAPEAALLPNRECSTLPTSMWLFLLVSYLLLLAFNFSYSFQTAGRLTWKPELLYTALFLAGWYLWDSCQATWWFPLALLKGGLILFLIAILLAQARKKAERRAVA